ncbi:MAG: ABC transporter ATP-binding protein [Erysipelotrichaceae bacterium]|nr:ABC transporter ATP-binding protein [Erysipelotrichaceae bacterium]
MPVIRLDDVTKIYPFQQITGLFDRKRQKAILEKQKAMPYTSNEGVVALQHFSSEIKDGEFVVILGPSGSGKSTLLRIIAGLDRPDLGTIYFDNIEHNGVRPQDRDVAMVFQNFSLYPNKTVYQNIAFPLEVKHTPREEIETEVRNISEILGLSSKLTRMADELSGGEQQRVAIARALVKRPKVLLFDEPFANLDVLMRNSLRNQLKKLHKAYHSTFIYVTHDQYDALSLAERIIILKDGIKQMDDTIANVYNYPVNRFCAEFLGSPAMNFIDDVQLHRDGKFTMLDQQFQLPEKIRKQIKKDTVADVGFRGVSIRIGPGEIEATVEYCEQIEADLLIHLKVADRELIAVERSSEDEMRYIRNQKVRILLDPETFHFFDKNGKRL